MSDPVSPEHNRAYRILLLIVPDRYHKTKRRPEGRRLLTT